MSTIATAIKKWKLDTNHTNIGFKIGHLGMGHIRGFFNEYEGDISLNGESFEDSEINLTIFTDSINTGNDMRDNHLKTPEFLDAFTFPEITFNSNSVKKTGENTFDITGELTIRETTKTVTFQAKHPGITKDMWGNTVAIFLLSGKIDRTEFGVEWYNVLDNGLSVVSKEVEFDMNIELIPDEE